MYPSVYTLFFFTTNSPVEIYIYIYMHFFFSKSISRLFTTLFFLHYFFSDTMCNGTCGGELFFRDVHSKDEKKLHSQKKRVFSVLHKFRLLDHWYLFFLPPPSPPTSLSFSLTRCSRPKFRLCYFCCCCCCCCYRQLHNVRKLESSLCLVFYMHYFFRIF